MEITDFPKRISQILIYLTQLKISLVNLQISQNNKVIKITILEK